MYPLTPERIADGIGLAISRELTPKTVIEKEIKKERIIVNVPYTKADIPEVMAINITLDSIPSQIDISYSVDSYEQLWEYTYTRDKRITYQKDSFGSNKNVTRTEYSEWVFVEKILLTELRK